MDGTLVSWTARPGKLYQLQSTTNWASGDWLNVDEPITASTTNLAAIDRDSSSGGHRFYRVRVVE